MDPGTRTLPSAANRPLGKRLARRASRATKASRRRRDNALLSAEEAVARLEEAQRAAHIGSWEWDIASDELVWSDELYRMYGLDPRKFDASFEAFIEHVHPEDRAMTKAQIQAALESGAGFSFRRRVVRPGGSVVTVQSRGEVVADDAGNAVGMRGTCQDISELQESEQAATDAEARFRTAFQHTAAGMAIVDLDGVYVKVNEALCKILKRSEDDLLGRNWRELTHPDHVEPNEAEDQRLLAGEISTSACEKRYLRPNGAVVWAMRHAAVVRDEHERPLYWVVQVQDISARRRHEEALRLQGEITANMAEGVCLTRARDGVVVYANRKFEQMFGYELGELIGKPASPLTTLSDGSPESEAATREFTEAIEKHGSWKGEVENVRKNGTSFWSQANISRFEHAEHGPVYVSVQSDISARRRADEKLQYLADHDGLTGLLNRRRFAEELDRHVAHVTRYRRPCGLLTIDLDNFKKTNDTLGHTAGDAVLKNVTRVLERTLRQTDTIGRLGGDEFAVLLPETDTQEAVIVAGKLVKRLREALMMVDSQSLRGSASIGVSAFDGYREVSADELMLEADRAMYEAKEAGRDRWSLYQIGIKQRRTERVDAAHHIREALERERFVLHVQPLLNLVKNEVDRYEVLLRMRGENDELIPPGAFLGAAERYGLIKEVDRHVIKRAIALAAERELNLNVNLSAHSLEDQMLPDLIERELKANGAEASQLAFEVTETAAITNIARARQLAERLRELGCGFALDDFGAGFASFYYLKQLPFDTLKIDGAFVRDLPSGKEDQLVVKAVVDVARGLGKKTVAEFVENEETLDLLRKEGVDYAQGFHISRPHPVEEIPAAA